MDIREKINELISAPSCCAELKAAAQAYLAAAEEDKKSAAAALIAELEEDVMGIDDVIAFFSSDAAVAHFGAETAKNLLEGMKAHKAQGGKYCCCPACAAGAAILENRQLL